MLGTLFSLSFVFTFDEGFGELEATFNLAIHHVKLARNAIFDYLLQLLV